MNENEKGRWWDSFEADGFKTGRVTLPGINLQVDLKPHQFFRYDGVQSSIYSYLQSLPDDIRVSLQGISMYKVGGYNQVLEYDGATGYIMVVKDISPRVNVHNEAHESAEIAASFGFKQELQKHVESLGYRVDINSLSGHQIGVAVGYIQARVAGYDMANIYRDQDPSGFSLLNQLHLVN